MTLFLMTLLRLSLLGSVLTCLLVLFRRLLGRRVSPAVFYYLWLPVLLRLCVPAGITVTLPAVPAPAETVSVSQNVLDGAPDREVLPSADGMGEPDGTDMNAAVDGYQVQPSSPTGETAGESRTGMPDVRELIPGLLLGLWGLGAAVSLGRCLWSYRRFSRAVRRCAGKPGREAADLLGLMDPSGRAELAVSGGVSTPMVLGVVRPVIVLPDRAIAPGQLEDILAHELTHIRWWDVLYKWFAMAVTALHWFNPLMILLRRELDRLCELSCDEAVIRRLTPIRRRRYGETLLAMAAEPPARGGWMRATLSEGKTRLRERLVAIGRYHRSGPSAVLLTLALAVVLGGCALIGDGTRAPAETTPPPAESDDPAPTETVWITDDLLADVQLCELADGLSLAIPQDIADQLLIFYPDQPPEGEESSSSLLSVYEKKSYEQSMEENGFEMGYLFSVIRYTPVQYEQEYLACQGGFGGLDIFARDDEWYYGWNTATDVQFYRTGGEIGANSQDWKDWEDLYNRMDEIRADFANRNGLTAYSGAADLNRDFLWEGEHCYVNWHSDDWSWSMTLLLSQPAGQGDGGIWCVEQWYDNNYGNQYWVWPRTDMLAADYYAALQEQADRGERTELLDPLTAALAWVREDRSDPTIQTDSLRLLEAEPGGNVFGRIRSVLGQGCTVELGTCTDGRAEGGQPCEDPDGGGLSGNSLYALVWARAQAPDTLEGDYVRITAADGSELLFLEENDLLRVTRDGMEEWFTPAYDYDRTAYDRVYDPCQSWLAAAG